MNNACILLYDPVSSPWAGKVKQYCAIQSLRLRVVERSQLSHSVGALARGTAAEPLSPSVPAVPEPVLVFCGLHGAQLDHMLAALRRMEVPRSVMKAVLTPTNAAWTFAALYSELCRERSAVEGKPKL